MEWSFWAAGHSQDGPSWPAIRVEVADLFEVKVLVLGLMLIEKVVLISRVTLQVIVVVKVQFQVLGLIVYVAF